MEESNKSELKAELIYGLNDRPPLRETLFAALQHLLAIFVAIITPPLIIAGALKLDIETTSFLVSMALFASGVSTFIQCRRIGGIGTGLLCIQGTSFSFIGPIISAGLTGGLPVIFGACMAASTVEMLISRLLKYTRKIITPLVSGIVVSAEYDMRSVSAKLYLTYTINNRGAVKVNQKMVADKGKKASDMFRFGMQLVMPKDFEYVSYYGRGPVENYSNRNHSTDLGIYHQTVDEQFYPYIRPQETGTKTDIRWWKVLDVKGTGLQFVADAPFSASSLHYTIESLDEGPVKKQGHSQEVEKADLTNVLIDKAQMGLACIDSWGAMPEPEFRLPYEDYEFTFIMTPVSHNYPLY